MRPFDAQAFLDSAGLQGTVNSYRNGDTVYSQGQACEAVMYLQSGEVTLSVLRKRGKEAIVAVLGPATGLTVYQLLTMKPAAGGPGAAADVAVAAGA